MLGNIASSQIVSIEAMCLNAVCQYTHTCILPPLSKFILIWVIGNYLILIIFTQKIVKLFFCHIISIYNTFSSSLCSLLLNCSHQPQYVLTGTKMLAIKYNVDLVWLIEKTKTT